MEQVKSKWNPESTTEMFHKYDVLLKDMGEEMRIFRHNAKLDTNIINALMERIKKLEEKVGTVEKEIGAIQAYYGVRT